MTDTDTAHVAGWSVDYCYVSEFIKKVLIEAKVVEVKGGFGNNYRGEIIFDNGYVLSWFEDSEDSGIDISNEGL